MITTIGRLIRNYVQKHKLGPGRHHIRVVVRGSTLTVATAVVDLSPDGKLLHITYTYDRHTAGLEDDNHTLE